MLLTRVGGVSILISLHFFIFYPHSRYVCFNSRNMLSWFVFLGPNWLVITLVELLEWRQICFRGYYSFIHYCCSCAITLGFFFCYPYFLPVTAIVVVISDILLLGMYKKYAVMLRTRWLSFSEKLGLTSKMKERNMLHFMHSEEAEHTNLWPFVCHFL